MRAYITIIDDNEEVRVYKALLTPYRTEHDDASMTTEYEFQFKLRVFDENFIEKLSKGELKINGCL